MATAGALCAARPRRHLRSGLARVDRRLIDDVRARGDEAVCDALARFDRVTLTPDELRVTADELAEAAVSATRSTAPSTTPSPTAGRSTSS